MQQISRGLSLAVIASLLVTLGITNTSTPATSLALQQAQHSNLGQHFAALGVTGSILIYDANQDRWYQHNPQRNNTAFSPASTFKILNSLIALETGVVSNELSILTWDGVERSLPEWNRDLNMKEAIKVSAVWFYQVLARRIGYSRMQQWINEVGYGNQQIGQPGDIDQFWLEGNLRITPQQQIQFLRRLQKNELPFAPKVMNTVKDIMVVEQTPTYTLRGKTGWGGFFGTNTLSQPQVGWFVGYLEQGKNTYFVATNIEIKKPQDAKARLEITRRSLKDLGLL